MRRFLIPGGIVFFAAVWVALLPTKLSLSPAETFSHDPSSYNLGAVHLVQDGVYSLDGEKPFVEREPGYSVFLAMVYAIFGLENRFAIFAVQGFLFLVAALFFVRELGRHIPGRVPSLTFLLLVMTAPIYHAVFSAYREGFALVLFLLTTTAFLRWWRTRSFFDGLFLGLSLVSLILTYFPYVFLPLFLLPLLFLARLERRELARAAFCMICIPYMVVSLWGLRNALQTGHFSIVGNERSTIMWHVRGEQSEHLRGIEPILCLWAEYISRDWTHRSSYCSTNGVVHVAVENGVFDGDFAAVAAEGREKILRYFPHYLWFSIIEILEFHFPYVNGWGFRYNALAALGAVVLYLGCLLSLTARWKRDYLVFLVIGGYSTLVFILTDATPRYNIPTLFAYATVAALGYDSALSWVRRRRQKHPDFVIPSPTL